MADEKSVSVATLDSISAKLDIVMSRLLFHETKLDDLLGTQVEIESRLNGLMAPKQ
jgi:hypothetical protein